MRRSGLLAVLIICTALLITGCVQQPGSSSRDQSHATFGENRNLTVYFIDVGHGDSILIRSPEGKTMLIDAGLPEASPAVLQTLRDVNVTSLDILLATHSHKDHIGGMTPVLAAFPVGEVIYNGVPGTTKLYKQFMKTIKNDKIPLVNVTAGDTIGLDPALSLTVLNPQKTYFDDPNNNSVVIRLVYRNVSFLFTGDAAQGAESAMLASGDNLNANILKVGHHGDSRSTSTEFLKAVRPAVAIIEARYEPDHHNPSNKTLARLAAANVTVYRTDLNGTTVVTTDGSSWTVSAFNKSLSPAVLAELPGTLPAAVS